MQIRQKKNKNKRKIIIVIVLVVLAASGLTAFAKVNNLGPFQKEETAQNKSKKHHKKVKKNGTKDKTNKKDGSSTEESAKQADDSEVPTTDEDDGKTPLQYESDNGNSANSASSSSTTITGTVGMSVDSNGAFVQVSINQQLASGTCTLSMTGPNGQAYNDTANVAPNPQSSSCEGWTIPTSKLGSYSGKWKITVRVTSGNKSGTISNTVAI